MNTPRTVGERILPLFLLAGLIFVGGCKTFMGNLNAVDEKRFDRRQPNADLDAVIEISVPQIYSRESLINDRREERSYLGDLLEASKTIPFAPELARDLTTISTLALDLGLAFDPAKALEFEKAREQFELSSDLQQLQLRQQIEDLEASSEARALQREIDVAKLQIELERLKADLALSPRCKARGPWRHLCRAWHAVMT